MSTPTTSAAILAGGRARRFGGQDKSRLVVLGRSIIVRQVDILQRVADQIFVVGVDADRFADLGLATYPDRTPGLGAIGGLLTALERARGERVLVVACDLPFIDAGVLRALVDEASRGDGAWVRTDRGVEPLLACYNRVAHERIRNAVERGTRKLSDLGSVLTMAPLEGAALAAFGPPERLITNVNSPDDYARVQYPPS